MIRLKATTIAVSSEDIAKIYKNEIWKIHGVLPKILSDKEPQFALWFMKDLEKTLGTKGTLYTVYHPQIDGQTKIINQEVKVFLQHYINYQQNDWTEWLLAAEF